MIPILMLFTVTMIAALLGTVSPSQDACDLFQALCKWGIQLLGKAITIIVIMNAVWIGLRTIGLLK